MVQTQRRYTADEWLDSPQNTTLAELVDGITVERMSTSGDHDEVANVLWRWLDQAHLAGYGRMYAGPTGVLLDPDGARNNVREPDFYFFRQGRFVEQACRRSGDALICPLFPDVPLPAADLFAELGS